MASNGELMFWLRFCWWVWVGYAGSGDDEVKGSVEAERVVEERETPVEVGERKRECFYWEVKLKWKVEGAHRLPACPGGVSK